MKQFVQNEEAVSPVIGVILMVAITVILAAVIAAFVFGMTGNVQTTKTVAITAGQNGNDIILTYQGGADAATLNYLKIQTNNNPTSYYYSANSAGTSWSLTKDNPQTGYNTSVALPVGNSITMAKNGTSERNHVVVVGHFMDGADQVVLDTYV